jgi:putative endonuclease
MDLQPCVYILANKRNGTLYVGVTSNLPRRIWEHKTKVVESFTRKYSVDKLMWYEVHESMESARQREKTIKFWKRNWKLKKIEEMNPDWRDLYDELI